MTGPRMAGRRRAYSGTRPNRVPTPFRQSSNATSSSSTPPIPPPLPISMISAPKQDSIVLDLEALPKQETSQSRPSIYSKMSPTTSRSAASEVDDMLNTLRTLNSEENDILGQLQRVRQRRQTLIKRSKQLQDEQLFKLGEQLDSERTNRTKLEQRLSKLEAQLHLLSSDMASLDQPQKMKADNEENVKVENCKDISSDSINSTAHASGSPKNDPPQ